MLKLRSGRPLGEADCQRWQRAQPTASAGPSGRANRDRYEIDLLKDATQNPEALFDRARDALMRYRTFPPNRIESRVCTPAGKIEKGALITQRFVLGPFWLECACRVSDVTQEDTPAIRRFAVTYETLQGHPERGVKTCELVLDRRTGNVRYTAVSWTESATLFRKMVGLWGRRHQKRVNQEAMEWFATLVTTLARRHAPT